MATLIGDSGNNSLTGTIGDDSLSGLEGNDTLSGFVAGNDSMAGGPGDDVYYVANQFFVISENAGEGVDTLIYNGNVRSQPHIILPDNVENLQFADFFFDSIMSDLMTGIGNALDNTIVGGSGQSNLHGGDGNDYIVGGDGISSGLYGDAGNDTLTRGKSLDVSLDGGAGNDLLDGRGARTAVAVYDDAVPMYVDLRAGTVSGPLSGNDTLLGITGVSTNIGADTLIGDGGANSLFSDDGDDFLAGGDGDDTLCGSWGNDTLTGGPGQDVFLFRSLNDLTANGDHIRDLDGNDTIDLSWMTGLLHFIGAAAFSGLSGQVRYTFNGASTILLIDSNGDGLSDKQIVLDNAAFALAETSPGSNVLRAVPSNIETHGATVLAAAGSGFLVGGASGPSSVLTYQGANVVAGQFDAWTPIAAEKTSGGYEIAWKFGSVDQYIVWNTDANGNYLNSPILDVPGSNSALQSTETLFQQDLNGDGHVGEGLEANGTTILATDGSQFYLQDGAGAGTVLKYQGANVVAGQFGAWAPIGAETAGNGYEIAWHNGSTGQYILWTTDANGNYVSSPLFAAPGSDPTLDSAETLFHQDLNGDGHVGVPAATPIETNGATKLATAANLFYLQDGAGAGPVLKYQGANVVAGQFGAWAPIGAETAGNGYEIAWHNGSTGQYILWTTDANGNYVSSPLLAAPGSDHTLESAETLFQQDLNGDGTLGVTIQGGGGGPVTTPIETNGVTKLATAANLFYLQDGTGAGPVLKYQGANVVAGQFGAWAPIGADTTGNGYEIAWHNGSTDQYILWTTDANGNYVSSPVVNAPGSDPTLETAETLFQQDLNNDGHFGLF